MCWQDSLCGAWLVVQDFMNIFSNCLLQLLLYGNYFFLFSFFETGSHVSQTGLKLAV